MLKSYGWVVVTSVPNRILSDFLITHEFVIDQALGQPKSLRIKELPRIH